MTSDRKDFFTWEGTAYPRLAQLIVNENTYELRVTTATITQQTLIYTSKILRFRTEYFENELKERLLANKGLFIKYEIYQVNEQTRIEFYLEFGEEMEINVAMVHEEETKATEDDIHLHAVQFTKRYIYSYESAERYRRQVNKIVTQMERWISEQKKRHNRKAEYFTKEHPERAKIYYGILRILEEVEQRIKQSLSE